MGNLKLLRPPTESYYNNRESYWRWSFNSTPIILFFSRQNVMHAVGFLYTKINSNVCILKEGDVVPGEAWNQIKLTYTVYIYYIFLTKVFCKNGAH